MCISRVKIASCNLTLQQSNQVVSWNLAVKKKKKYPTCYLDLRSISPTSRLGPRVRVWIVAHREPITSYRHPLSKQPQPAPYIYGREILDSNSNHPASPVPFAFRYLHFVNHPLSCVSALPTPQISAYCPFYLVYSKSLQPYAFSTSTPATTHPLRNPDPPPHPIVSCSGWVTLFLLHRFRQAPV